MEQIINNNDFFQLIEEHSSNFNPIAGMDENNDDMVYILFKIACCVLYILCFMYAVSRRTRGIHAS